MLILYNTYITQQLLWKYPFKLLFNEQRIPFSIEKLFLQIYSLSNGKQLSHFHSSSLFSFHPAVLLYHTFLSFEIPGDALPGDYHT